MSLAFLALLPQLIAAAVATVDEVKSVLAARQPGMSDVEMNAILSLIQAGASRHLALAQADSKP